MVTCIIDQNIGFFEGGHTDPVPSNDAMYCQKDITLAGIVWPTRIKGAVLGPGIL
jgi:hypothetical protein